MSDQTEADMTEVEIVVAVAIRDRSRLPEETDLTEAMSAKKSLMAKRVLFQNGPVYDVTEHGLKLLRDLSR